MRDVQENSIHMATDCLISPFALYFQPKWFRVAQVCKRLEKLAQVAHQKRRSRSTRLFFFFSFLSHSLSSYILPIMNYTSLLFFSSDTSWHEHILNIQVLFELCRRHINRIVGKLVGRRDCISPENRIRRPSSARLFRSQIFLLSGRIEFSRSFEHFSFLCKSSHKRVRVCLAAVWNHLQPRLRRTAR